MSKEDGILCIDVSSQKIKVAIVSENCDIIAIAEKNFFFKNDDIEGFAKSYNTDEIWNILMSCIKDVIRKSKINPMNILGITSCTQRQACVFLSDEGEVIYAGPNCDIRGIDSQYLIDDEFEEEELFNITGHNPPLIFPLARLLWFQEEREDLFEKIGKVLLFDDWIVYKLTDIFCTDPTSAAESLIFDVSKSKWSDKIIDTFDFNRDLFPEIIQVSDIVGDLKTDIAKKFNLPKSIPVVKTGADTQASLIGTACIEDNQIGITIGTTAPLYLVVNSPRLDPNLNMWTTLHAIKDKWLIESNTGMTGKIYDWYKDSFLSGLSNDLDSITEKYLLETEPGANSTLAFLGPERMDINSQTNIKPGVFILPTPGSISEILSDRKNFLRAIFENIGFGILENLIQILNFEGNHKEIFFSGGLANSKSFNQILSNILNKELYLPNIKESAFSGEAINVLIGLEYYQNYRNAINKLVKLTKISPDEDIALKYEKIYHRWSRIKKQLKFV